MELAATKIFRGDRVIWIILLLLSLLSLLIVYSSTGALAYRQASGNTLVLLNQAGVFSWSRIWSNGINGKCFPGESLFHSCQLPRLPQHCTSFAYSCFKICRM